MIDQIILSSNEDPTYFEFWEPVSQAYKKMFPNTTVHLAFLTERGENDELVKHLRQFGLVTLFKPVEGILHFSQAKLIRFILAAYQREHVCYIDDIDLFPLKRTFITDKVNKRPAGHLLCVGGEVYGNNGCFPVSQMTAEGYVWNELINPNYLDYTELMVSFLKMPIMFDACEDLNIPFDLARHVCFSDEKFLRKLRTINNVPIFELERGYNDFLESTLDRYDWRFSQEKLDAHGYVNAHGPRPYSKYEELYAPLTNYVNRNY